MLKSLRTVVVAVASVALASALALEMMTALDPSHTEESAEWKALPYKLQVMSRISAERFEAVDELLANRQSLAQTAATFRRLSSECPYDPLPYLGNLYPGRSEEELQYLHVIRYVEAVQSQGGTSEAAVQALRDEYEMRRHTGDFRADDVP